MNAIPWYRSPVFTLGLTAALGQLVAMITPEFITGLVAGKPGALAQLGSFLLTAVVVGVRVAATAQPITLTKAGAEAANGAPAKQGGFARPAMLAMLLGCSVLALPVMHGCTALGLQQPESFDQRYAYALSQTSALRLAATEALQLHQITSADAEYVLKVTDQSRALLDRAREAYQFGDQLKGKSQLEVATSVMLELQRYLNLRSAK